VTFDAGSSTDPDGTIVSYTWAFGDGFNGNGVVVSHAFVHSGRFSVVLTVVDNNQTSNAASLEITVDFPPIAAFSASLQAAPAGLPIRFDAFASTDSDGTIVSYAWDFGDGHTGTGISITHSFASNGTFTVRLTVADDLGVTDETASSIEIGNRAPTIAFASPPSTFVMVVGETQTFVVVASDPDGDPLTYSWIADGLPVGGSSSSYEFVGSTLGSHVIRVLVSDGFVEVGVAWAVEVRTHTQPAQLPVEPFPEGLYLQVFAAGALASIGVVFLTRHLRRRGH
jgi:chitodextrinase